MCFKKTLCRIQDSEISSPLHPSGRNSYSVWTLICQATFVRTTRSFRLNDEIFSSKLPSMSRSFELFQDCIHSDVSAIRSNAFQCSTSKRISFPKYRYGKIATTIRTTWLFRLDAVLDKARRAEDLQPSGRSVLIV
jgi:hypothetical protein